MSADPQWKRWQDAVDHGARVETEPGNPASGFYRNLTGQAAPRDVEAVCIYRDETGKLQCIRNVFGDGSRMHDDEIDDLFAKVCLYPVAHEVYVAVAERGEPWPAEYGVGGRLTGKDQQAGVAWTPAYGRKRLGLDKPAAPAQEAAENPRAVIGGNLPPEATKAAGGAPGGPAVDPAATGHTIEGEQTPDKLAFVAVSALGAETKVYLAGIGGAPRDKEQADEVADFATRFGALGKQAEDARVAEKAPVLAAGRAIDAKWKRPIDDAAANRKTCLALAAAWFAAERERALAGAAATGPGAKPVTSVGNLRTVSQRGRAVWTVTDPHAFLAHLAAQDGELPGEIVDALAAVARRQARAAPGVTKEDRRSAA